MPASSAPVPEETNLEKAIDRWLADPDGDVVYAEKVGSRWAVRMRQTVRDATTVWWDVGTYTISAEAYVLPPLDQPVLDIYRLVLQRNEATWRAHFALDSEGALFIRGRLSRDSDFEELDALLGEIYWLVESTFRPLIRLVVASREKTS